jgi:hypothetical protein
MGRDDYSMRPTRIIIRRFIIVAATFLTPYFTANASFVQSVGSDTAVAATSFAQTYGSAVTSGNTLIALVSISTSCAGGITITVSDNVNAGNWTSIGNQVDNSNCSESGFFYKQTTGAGTPTVTASTPSSQFYTLIILEYSGLSGGVDQSASTNNTNVSTITTPSVTTTNANDLIVVGIGANDGGGNNFGTTTVTSPYTMRKAVNVGGASVADQTVSSTGTITGGAFSWSFSQNPQALTAAFKLSGGTPPVISVSKVRKLEKVDQ